MEAEDGDKGVREAKIAGGFGRVAGLATRKLYNTTGLNYITNAPVRSIVAIADVSNEVDKLKRKQKEDLANGLEVVKGR